MPDGDAVSSPSVPPEFTPEPDLDFSGRGKLMLCSSRFEGDGDAMFIDISFKINYKPVTLDKFTSTSLPGILCKPPVHQHSAPINQVPSQTILDDHLPAPPVPSHVEAQAQAHKPQTLGLTTTLVPLYPRSRAPEYTALAQPLTNCHHAYPACRRQSMVSLAPTLTAQSKGQSMGYATSHSTANPCSQIHISTNLTFTPISISHHC